MYMCVYVHVCVCTCVCMYVGMRVCTYMCVYVHTCVCACTYVHVCVYWQIIHVNIQVHSVVHVIWRCVQSDDSRKVHIGVCMCASTSTYVQRCVCKCAQKCQEKTAVLAWHAPVTDTPQCEGEESQWLWYVVRWVWASQHSRADNQQPHIAIRAKQLMCSLLIIKFLYILSLRRFPLQSSI